MNRDDIIAEACQVTATRYGSTFHAELERCPHAASLRYKQGIVPVKMDEALLVGSLVHVGLGYAGLRAVYGLRPDKHGWADALEAYAEKNELDFGVLHKAVRLLTSYWARWGYDNAGYPADAEILDVERPIEVWLGPDGQTSLSQKSPDWICFTSTLDAVLESESGEIVIMDHKTRSKFSKDDLEEHASIVSRRPQYLAMCAAVTLLSKRQPLFVDNLLVKTTIPKYHRVPFRVSPDLIRAWAHQQYRTRKAFDADPWRQNFSACAGSYRPCWAFKFCHGSDTDRTERFLQILRKPH